MNRKHGHYAGGNSPTLSSWASMKARCSNPNDPKWRLYGGRGITVCQRWLRFEYFLEDMGERPPGMSLDRINSHGNYEPGNCRWATITEQNRNRSGVKLDARKACQIRWLYEMGYKQAQIGRMYGVCNQMVSLIVREKSWLV